MTENKKFVKIYKIISNVSSDVYIGSTYKTLEQQLELLETNYSIWRTWESPRFPYHLAYELIKLDHYQIILLENLILDNVWEITKINDRKNFHIEQNPKCINKKPPLKSFFANRCDHKERKVSDHAIHTYLNSCFSN